VLAAASGVELLEKAVKNKASGNEHFKKSAYKLAITAYTE